MRHTPEQWKALFVAQQASGMTMAAFCHEHGIRPKSFYYWHRKLVAKASINDTFVRVPLPPQPASVCTLRVGSAELVLGDVSPSWLAALMRALA